MFKDFYKGNIPKVTVITVVRNMKNTIEDTVLSVLNQTYENIEYIVIDGCSSDGTLDVLEPYIPQFDQFVSEQDESLYHAMNKGIHIATGDLLLFLNADDSYYPYTVQALVDHMHATGSEVVSAQAININGAGEELDKTAYMQYNSTILMGMPFRHELMLVPMSLYRKLGYYNTQYSILADWEFAIRMWRAGIKVSQLRLTLMKMCNTGVSITEFDIRVKDVRKLFRDIFPFLTEETCTQMSDPRIWTSDLCLQLVERHKSELDFCQLIVDHGFRRQLLNPANSPKVFRCPSIPQLSVIVPVYNASESLGRALQSVLSKADLSVEIICVEDCSSDSSPKVLQALGECDDRIKIYQNKVNSGVSYSRNRGLQLATGKFVFFLDADDELIMEGLTASLTTAESNNSDAVICSYEVLHNNKTTLRSRPPQQKNLFNRRFTEISQYFMHNDYPKDTATRTAGEGFWSCLYRREQAQNITFRSSLDYGEDSLYLLSFLCQAKRISWIDKPVYRYNELSNGSAMTKFSAKRWINTVEWRLLASTILRNNNIEELASFLVLRYWPGQFGKLLTEADFTKEQRLKLKSMLEKIDTTFFVKPEFYKKLLKNEFFKEQILLPKIDNAAALMPVSVKRVNDVNKLKVNIFMTTDRGGAAQGSFRRMKALRASGCDASIHVGLNNRNEDNVINLKAVKNKHKEFVDTIINEIYQKDYCVADELFSNMGSIVSFKENSAYFKEADIVHFHWITGMMDEQNWNVVKNKPVCWTLADMNAFTGGCHYSEGCDGYKRECNDCPLLTTHKNIAHEQWKRKKKLYSQMQNLTIICPSEWMASCVRASSLLGDKNIVVIPNAMPVDKFKPDNQMVARIKLGLPLDKKIILFGADDNSCKRKGGDILHQSMTELSKSYDSDDIVILTFGHYKLDLPFPVISKGYVDNESDLSLMYSAADCYCFPSRADNAPLTVGESMLCGTPVVATPVGNVRELIQHQKTGYICKDWSPAEMCKGVRFVLNTFIKRDDTGLPFRIRKIVAAHNDPDTAAQRHLAVYNRVVNHDTKSL